MASQVPAGDSDGQGRMASALACPSASMARVLRLPPINGEAMKSRPRSRVPSSDSMTFGDSRLSSVSTPCTSKWNDMRDRYGAESHHHVPVTS